MRLKETISIENKRNVALKSAAYSKIVDDFLKQGLNMSKVDLDK